MVKHTLEESLTYLILLVELVQQVTLACSFYFDL